MPKLELKCGACGHMFERLVLRGEEKAAFRCPECGERRSVRPLPGSESLFEGIAGFSELAGDTN